MLPFRSWATHTFNGSLEWNKQLAAGLGEDPVKTSNQTCKELTPQLLP